MPSEIVKHVSTTSSRRSREIQQALGPEHMAFNCPLTALHPVSTFPGTTDIFYTDMQTVSSSTSRSSRSISAACFEAETEHAALSAKVQTLEKKHALGIEEATLKAKQEKLALAADLAAAEAKAKILRQAGTGPVILKSSSRISQQHSASSKLSSARMQKTPAPKTTQPSLKAPGKLSRPITAPVNSHAHATRSAPENVLAGVLRRQNEMLAKQQKAYQRFSALMVTHCTSNPSLKHFNKA